MTMQADAGPGRPDMRQTILVTGAAGNLGRAVAARLAADGANLVLVGRSRQSLDAAFAGQRDGQMTVAADLLDRAAVARSVDDAVRRFGAIDGVCATAGGFHMGATVHDTPPEVWRKMQDLNVSTLLNTVAAVVPGMVARKRGRIVTVGAGAGLKGVARMAAYCAAKSTVMRISEAMSGELSSDGIAVNCVLPGIIDTPENRAAMPGSDRRGWVAPEAIAETIAFLLSPASAAINGALVPVAG